MPATRIALKLRERCYVRTQPK